MVFELFLAVLIAMMAIMTVAWFVQRAARDGGWTDVFWTFGAGTCLAAAALAPIPGDHLLPARQGLVAAMVGAWSLRLGLHIRARVLQGPEDARYAGFRRDWGEAFNRRMWSVMLPQAPAAALLSPSIILAARTGGPLNLRDGLALLLFLACLAGESLADRQLRRFKATPGSHGKVCDVGLWAWSRHPNYFFEAALWLAYPVIALNPARLESALSLVAPVVMFITVRFLSGVPPLETAMLRSRGEAYRDYQARVSIFIPRPPRRSTRPHGA
ncbi:MAG: DUF1295 domain-containing protein [Alphaproteobacteria bacterium]|nr:DUF1295 domain-containing protein [Alphaproteobacteria bacterium]